MFDSDVGSFGLCVRVSRKALVSARRYLNKESHLLSKPRAGLCQSHGDVKGLRRGVADCGSGPVEPKKAHFHITLEKETFCPGVLRVAARMFPRHNKDEGAQATCGKRGSQVHLGNRKTSRVRRARRGLQNPLLSDLRVFFPWAALTISLAAHPPLQLMLLGVKSGAGSERRFCCFFSAEGMDSI